MKYFILVIFVISFLSLSCNQDSVKSDKNNTHKKDIRSKNSNSSKETLVSIKNKIAIDTIKQVTIGSIQNKDTILHDKIQVVAKEPKIQKKTSIPKKKIKQRKRRKKRKQKIIKKPKGRLDFVEESYNFGVLIEGDEIDHVFKFKNVGLSPITIKDVTVSCGCTTPNYPFMDIEPGQFSQISVHYSSKNKWAHQNPSLTVYTNGNPSEYILYLEGDVHERKE